MDADFSIELGRDDPVLDFPWRDPSGEVAYFDLKRHPELIARIEEAEKFPELGEFLKKVNSARGAVESAKCDAWETSELSAEEEIFNASHKFASYVDLVFSDPERRRSLPFHESFARMLTELLRRAPEVRSAVEICVRRCFFGGEKDLNEGFYFTVYVNGYGKGPQSARRHWAIALNMASYAILQLSLSQLPITPRSSSDPSAAN